MLSFCFTWNPWFLRPVDENRGPLGTTTSVLRISDLAVWQGVQVQQTTCKISAKPLDMTAIWWWVSLKYLKYWNVVWYLQHCSAASSIEQNLMKSDSTNCATQYATQYATSRGLWITAIQHGELRTDQRNCWPRSGERSPERWKWDSDYHSLILNNVTMYVPMKVTYLEHHGTSS